MRRSLLVTLDESRLQEAVGCGLLLWLGSAGVGLLGGAGGWLLPLAATLPIALLVVVWSSVPTEACERCRESVRVGAEVCRHCGADRSGVLAEREEKRKRAAAERAAEVEENMRQHDEALMGAARWVARVGPAVLFGVCVAGLLVFLGFVLMGVLEANR